MIATALDEAMGPGMKVYWLSSKESAKLLQRGKYERPFVLKAPRDCG
jgi:hypothetical protein